MVYIYTNNCNGIILYSNLNFKSHYMRSKIQICHQNIVVIADLSL